MRPALPSPGHEFRVRLRSGMPAGDALAIEV